MSYRLLSSQNSTTNIYLVFNEIEIPNKTHKLYTDYDSDNTQTFKKYRHADGSLNATFPEFPKAQMWKDPGTNSDPFIIPSFNYTPEGASIDKNYILQNVGKYFEPFNVNILESSSVPFQWGNGTKDARYVKMIPPGLFISGTHWNALPPKFYPFKRATWWQDKEDIAVFNCAHPWHNFASIGHGISDVETLILSTVHEIGHLYNLEHQGDTRDSIDLIRDGLSYYSQNFTWLPLMGEPTERPLNHWANSDYKYAVTNGPAKLTRTVYENEFYEMLEGGIKLLKTPGTTFEYTRPGPNAGNLGLSKKTTEDTLYARYITSSNWTEVIGMIGYERDYDILKILVPKGYTLITVEAYGVGQEDRSMLDPRIEILYCQSEIEKLSLSEQFYADIWIPDTNSIPNLKNKNIFHKVRIENDGYTSQPKNTHSVGSPVFNTSNRFFSSSLGVNTESLTLVYIKVLGNWSGTVNELNKKPVVADQGYSNYGSVGKYKLKLSKPSFIDDSSYTLPYGRFEEFKYCKDGNYQTAWLLVQDENDNSQGDPSKNNIWVLELDSIINGNVQKKKFIVYGQPLPKDTPDVDGKFYLPILIDGVCKKQEFIVGMARPEENA